MEGLELWCQSCGAAEIPDLRWKRWGPGKDEIHLGAYCANCKRWLKWVKQEEPWLSAAPAKGP